MPITILDCAEARGLRKDDDGSSNMEDFHRVGFDMIGGCVNCHATIAAYNAYPSRGGYWCCEDCIGDFGFNNTADFEAWCVYQESQLDDFDADCDRIQERA